MTEELIDAAVNDFISKFNEMCKTERRDFLIRERTVTYESGPQIRTYAVTYQVKKKRDYWDVFAATSGFWIFKRKFPLFRIIKNGNDIRFEGLYTSKFSSFQSTELKEKLDSYIESCKKVPKNAFISS